MCCFADTRPLPRSEMSPPTPLPPPGYPVSDGSRVGGDDASAPAGRTQSRGDGFWRGW